MAFQLSPGINVSEIDLTTAIPSVSTSAGAFAGVFAWGPANTVVTISDEVRLVDTFGKPDSVNYEYWFSAANFLAYSNNLKVVRAANVQSTLNATANGTGVSIQNEDDYLDNRSAGTESYTFAARYPGALGNSLAISICPSANAYSQNLTSSNSAVSNAVAAGVTVINYDPRNGTTGNLQPVLTKGDLVTLDGGITVYAVDSSNANTITIQTATTVAYSEGSVITRYWKYYNQFDAAPGTSSYASNLSGANDEIHIVVIDEDGRFGGTANTVLERFGFASKASDAKDTAGNSNYYKNVINSRSKYIWWGSHASGGTNWGSTANSTTFTNVINPVYSSLSGGADGTVGTSQISQGYDKFKSAEAVDISLIITGPCSNTVADYVVSNLAETRKDCVAFISPRKTDVVDAGSREADNIVGYRNTLTSSSYAFMDSGWKYQYDKYNDVYRWIPLNADIAGLCVRTDSQRDPWFSPAGVNRGVIKNVVKLAWNPTKAERDSLYSKSVNPVVTVSGEGTILYGDKTMLSKPSAFDRINVRRLFIALEKSIARAARSSLFEFNDQFTRAQFVNLVEPFLRDVQGRRGITDFRVVCNETNNTAEVIDRNEFVGDIYIKPARSINFIQLNFVATRTGVSFDEVVGRF